jgi:hypothetical protein
MVSSKIAVAVAVVAIGASWHSDLMSLPSAFGLLFLAGMAFAAKSLSERAIFCLEKDEQLRVQGFTEVTVTNGPGVTVLNPFGYRAAQKRAAHTLSATDYLKIVNTADGAERIVKGPQLLFLGAYEQVKNKGSCETLTQTEYLRVENQLSGEITMVIGPVIWFPGVHDVHRRGKAKTLTSTQYVLVRDKLSGERHIVKGPCVWYPGAHEEGSAGDAISLKKTEYITVEDRETGERRIVQGPCNWFPGVNDELSGKKLAIALQEDQYVKLKDTAAGKQWIERGVKLVYLQPTWEVVGGVMKAYTLKAYEYIRLHDSTTGKTTMHRGEQTVFPEAHDELLDGKIMQAIDLKVHEYVKILNQATSEIRVEKGPKAVFLEPNEKMVEPGKQKGIEIDDDHAVLVRDKSTGVQRLVTDKQLFIPGPDETIEEVRELIKLSDHEAIIVKDGSGNFTYHYGHKDLRGNKKRAFFLPPFAEVNTLHWSSGQRRDQKNLHITKFDTRPQYMWFEFNCRTSDNVELILEGTFFWEVSDLPGMVKNTGDTSGDLCNHARSQFIRMVSRVTLKQFMEGLHEIARKVHVDDPEFYKKRGVKVHSLEITRYQCADRSTSEILEQIIQETTNRMNRLSQQESENEVKIFKINGQIEHEKLNTKLLAIQQEHQQTDSCVNGKAEAVRVSAFMDQLAEDVPDLQERLRIWQTLRKTDALSVVSHGDAHLYYTPNDVDLSIENRK